MYLSLCLEVKWECLGSSCYWMRTVKTARKKAEADDVCQAMGAHLWAPDTQQENDFVTNLAFRSGKSVYCKELR